MFCSNIMDRGYPLNAVLDFTNGAELQKRRQVLALQHFLPQRPRHRRHPE
jgi:hypothetical protein